MLRHEAQSGRDAVLDLKPGEVGSGKGHAARERQDAHDGVQQCRLAGAVGADDGDDLVLGDIERYATDCFNLAVGDVDIGQLQQVARAVAHVAAPR